MCKILDLYHEKAMIKRKLNKEKTKRDKIRKNNNRIIKDYFAMKSLWNNFPR